MNILKDDLKTIIGNRNDLDAVLEHLNDEQKSLVLGFIDINVIIIDTGSAYKYVSGI